MNGSKPTTNMSKKPTTNMSKKPTTPKQTPQFWIIDTDGNSASGPHASMKAAEAAIVANARDLWMDSCDCIRSDNDVRWCLPLHIVEVRRTVIPDITATIKLVDA
jgi:hypothetical protein